MNPPARSWKISMEGSAELTGGQWVDRVLAGKQPTARQHHPALAPGLPPRALQIEQGIRQHGIAVLSALALLDADHLTLASLPSGSTRGMSVSLSETTSEARNPVP